MKTPDSFPGAHLMNPLEFENGQAQLDLTGWPPAALEAVGERLQSFALHVNRGGSALIHGLYGYHDYRHVLVLAVDAAGAQRLAAEGPSARLSIWVTEAQGRRKICERPVLVRTDELRFPLSELAATLDRLYPAGLSQVGGLAALYNEFLPEQMQVRSEGPDVILFGAEVTPLVQDEINRLFHRGVLAMLAGHLKQGLCVLGRILRLDPTHLGARELIVTRLMEAGQLAGARVELQRILLLSPCNAWAWEKLAAVESDFNPSKSKQCLLRAMHFTAPNRGGSAPRNPALPVTAAAGKFIFTRKEVETMDFSRFLNSYATDRLPDGQPLADLMGTLTLGVEGFDGDGDEVWENPAVRKFYQALRLAWPYDLYFCDLSNRGFSDLILSCLPSLQSWSASGCGPRRVHYRPKELLELLYQGAWPLDDLWVRAGFTKQDAYHRVRAVFGYFSLPFEVKPPQL